MKLEEIAKWIVNFNYNLFESEKSNSIIKNYGAGNAGKKIAEYINTLTI
jgi:UDP-N-acetylglucosamine 2-epimerase